MERAICIVFFAVAAGGNGLCGDCVVGKNRLFFALQRNSTDCGKFSYSAAVSACHCADDFSLFFETKELAAQAYALLTEQLEYLEVVHKKLKVCYKFKNVPNKYIFGIPHIQFNFIKDGINKKRIQSFALHSSFEPFVDGEWEPPTTRIGSIR